MAEQQHIEQSPSSHSAEDDENAESFSAVLSTLDKEQLPLLASAILQRLQPLYRTTNAEPSVGEPLYGSYHVLFPLTFDTGLRWVAKIPINGTASKWDELSASALASEANTMRLLKRETTIPLPDVLDFSSTTQNTLRCPYILMTFISGVPLHNVWFGHRLNGASPETTRLRRIRALESIAAAIAQLDKFSFRTGGRLLFGNDGNPSGIGPMRQVDHKAMLDRWFVHNDPDDDTIYVECAASSDPRAHYTPILDRYPEPNQVPKGLAMLLRQLIDWIPEPAPSEMDPFVLAHPDFDIQTLTSRTSSYPKRASSEVSSIGMGSLLCLALLVTRVIRGGSRATGTRLCMGIGSLWSMGWNRKVCGKIRPNLSPITAAFMMA